jgi:anaphase-promoting complex subunit 2
MNALGTVQLELDVVEENPDGPPHIETKEFSCSPLLASLISHFEDKETWTAEELSDETGIPEHFIQKRMAYWISNRVVTFTSNDRSVEYKLTSLAERQREHHHGVMDDQDETGQAVSAAAQEEEEMEVYESYISVMLTSLQQAPLEKIHNMLKMLVSGSEIKYNKTPQQLSAFLQRLCQQEKLECGPDGMYKLLKK